MQVRLHQLWLWETRLSETKQTNANGLQVINRFRRLLSLNTWLSKTCGPNGINCIDHFNLFWGRRQGLGLTPTLRSFKLGLKTSVCHCQVKFGTIYSYLFFFYSLFQLILTIYFTLFQLFSCFFLNIFMSCVKYFEYPCCCSCCHKQMCLALPVTALSITRSSLPYSILVMQENKTHNTHYMKLYYLRPYI